MAEFRQNIATKEWVIIAPERARRPDDFKENRSQQKTLPVKSEKCPFCPGNERSSPQPKLLYTGDEGKWQVRVVPNKFAALTPDHDVSRSHAGLFLKAGGYGVAEVVIESPIHNNAVATLTQKQVELVVQAYRERYRAIAADDKINLITIFRNNGERAGTSLEHPHSQIIATPIVPPHIREPVFLARMSYDTHGSCIFCTILKEELQQKCRIILETEYFVALCPYAARSPFEVRIYPKIHHCAFGDISDVETQNFAVILRSMMRKIFLGLNNPDYNYIIRSAPTDDVHVKHYHWYVVIIPKVTSIAGFEIGTGIYINPSLPEESADYLRSTPINSKKNS